MMRLPLATRLGLLLFALFSALGLFLLALLYTLFSHSLAAQAAEELLHRGHGHADAWAASGDRTPWPMWPRWSARPL